MRGQDVFGTWAGWDPAAVCGRHPRLRDHAPQHPRLVRAPGQARLEAAQLGLRTRLDRALRWNGLCQVLEQGGGAILLCKLAYILLDLYPY